MKIRFGTLKKTYIPNVVSSHSSYIIILSRMVLFGPIEVEVVLYKLVAFARPENLQTENKC